MRHLTVVFTIHDEEAFEEENSRLTSLFKATLNPDGTPNGEQWAITAMSHGHEMNRVDAIQGVVDNADDAWDAIEDVRALIQADDVQAEVSKQAAERGEAA